MSSLMLSWSRWSFRGLFNGLVFTTLACTAAASSATEAAKAPDEPQAALSPILNKCHYWINDTGASGDLDMVTGGLNQLIDPERKIRLTLYHMRTDKNMIEIEARIFGPCTEADIAKAAEYRAGCYGHQFGQAIISHAGPLENLPSLNLGTENYVVKCEGSSK